MQAQAATGRAAHLRIHVVEVAEFDQAWIKYACAQASVGSVIARKEQGGVASTLRELAYASRKTTPVPIDSRMGRVENANRRGTNKGS